MPGAGTDKTKNWVREPGPVVILVEPQLGENIGAAARAMANFGLSRLRLVKPREAWPNPKARAMASGADRVLDEATVYETLEAAIADCTLVLATTARAHDQAKPVIGAPEAAVLAAPRVAAGETVGILFGRERYGLENAEVVLADRIVTLPVNPAFASLNLAQAVVIIGYEWFRSGDATPSERIDHGGSVPAPREELILLFEHLEEELEKSGFLFPPGNRPGMIRNLRSILHRAQLTDQEVRTLRGVIVALTKGKRRNPPGGG